MIKGFYLHFPLYPRRTFGQDRILKYFDYISITDNELSRGHRRGVPTKFAGYLFYQSKLYIIIRIGTRNTITSSCPSHSIFTAKPKSHLHGILSVYV